MRHLDTVCVCVHNMSPVAPLSCRPYTHTHGSVSVCVCAQYVANGTTVHNTHTYTTGLYILPLPVLQRVWTTAQGCKSLTQVTHRPSFSKLILQLHSHTSNPGPPIPSLSTSHRSSLHIPPYAIHPIHPSPDVSTCARGNRD